MTDFDELIFEREYRRMCPDWDTSTAAEKLQAFDYFCRNYWHIKVPRKRIKFEMREAQLDVVSNWIEHRFTIALKARQVGFSTLAGAFAFWLAFFYDNQSILMISKGEREAIKLLQKSRYGYRFLPEWLKLRGPVVDSNLTKIAMTNESVIESLPSAADPARGETASTIIVDEMGQLPNSEDAWASIEPVATIGGSIIMLGTANGEGNLFHKLWVGAHSEWGNSTNRFVGIFHSWRAVTERDDAWFEAQCAELPEWQRAQEYPDNPDEAFLKSGRPVFNIDMIRSLELEPPEARGYLYDHPSEGPRFVADGGALRIWRWPVEGHRYSMGVDVAEGLEHGDFSSIHLIDAKLDQVVAHWHGHIDPDLLGTDVAALIGRFYNNALAVVEANNHGGTTLKALQRAKYFPIYRRRRLGNRQEDQTEVMGWLTTVKSKPRAIDELNMDLREGRLTLWDKDTVAEMRTFVRDEKGRMNGSPHDDRVMSLAIANQGTRHVYQQEYTPKKTAPPGSIEFFLKSLEKLDLEDDRASFIGSSSVRAT
jgi:hypothetical protein